MGQRYPTIIDIALAAKGSKAAAMTEGNDERAQPRIKFSGLLIWAIITLLIGISPFLSSLLADAIASPLGCIVIEHGAYTRATIPDEFGYYGLSQGCKLGSMEIGPALHFMHMFIFAVMITWPFFLTSLVLWGAYLYRRLHG
jgi:hypothetical protein